MAATTTPANNAIVVPSSPQAVDPRNGQLVAVYQHLLDQMAKRINELEARIVALGG